MKNMKMKKIVASIGAAVALASVAQIAQADSLLFPVYKVGNGVFSFLSLNTIPNSPSVHYVWNAKVPDATGNIKNSDPCVHEDAFGKLTAFDLIQHTVESPTLGGGSMVDLQALFGDASTAAYSLVAPSLGFLTVTNGSPLESDFFGQMVLVDAASGVVTAYKGMNNPATSAEGQFNSVLTSKTIFNTTWYPTTEAGSKLGAAGVDTAWYATITGTNMHLPTWQGAGTFQNVFASGNVYNRDEGIRSGVKPAPLTCFGLLNRADFMTTAQVNHTVNGGISYQRFTPVVATGATGALLTKLETTTALGSRKTMISSENAFPNLPY